VGRRTRPWFDFAHHAHSAIISMNRVSVKIVGAQGQGINSVGEMCAKGLKRVGYCVFGYREYMSVIKGGHSSYQLDVSDEIVRSTQTHVDIVVAFNHHGITKNLHDLKEGGILIHQTSQWQFKDKDDQAFIEDNGIKVLYLPTEDILKKLEAKPILGNVLITSVVWALLGRSQNELKTLVEEQFGHKKDLLAQNLVCIKEGFEYRDEHASDFSIPLPEPDEHWQKQLLITGSQAMGLGIIHAGCRVFASYPMTPASPLLSYIADQQNESHMVVKQAEDEITAAQMMVGAMHMGTRAATATSGGGFDLMTETYSFAGMAEIPAVFILAQRPGPATGLPTWTAQGDLLLAVGSAHGELPRLVLGVSDSQDCFDLMPEAFNLAEEFQLPVTILTDKQAAEALFTQTHFDQSTAEVRRGQLVTEKKELAKLQSADRYNTSVADGVSLRWLPGTEAEQFCAQGYEHAADGSFDESSKNTAQQVEKRARKMETLRGQLPEPELFGSEDPEVLVVSWGSNKGVILDVLEGGEITLSAGRDQGSGIRDQVSYLHYTYLWPLKTERFERLAKKAKKTILVECNQQGQFGMLLKQQCGLDVDEKILKYDGRPFFYDELKNALSVYLS